AGPGVDRIPAGQKPRFLRAVDSKGILLPKKVPIPNDVLVLEKAPIPIGAAGKPWGDPLVHLAAFTIWTIDWFDVRESARKVYSKLRLTHLEWTPDGLLL